VRPQVVDDKDKIITAFSYMNAGSAASWAENFIDGHAGGFSMWNAFETLLDMSFTDHTATKCACDALEHLSQGRLTVDEFFRRFEKQSSPTSPNDAAFSRNMSTATSSTQSTNQAMSPTPSMHTRPEFCR
jgi:hypothetical protein